MNTEKTLKTIGELATLAALLAEGVALVNSGGMTQEELDQMEADARSNWGAASSSLRDKLDARLAELGQ